MNTQQRTVDEIDAELAQQYGDYAGFVTEASPSHIEYYGEDPHNEVKRLLAQLIRPDSKILDIGCGPGNTLCRTKNYGHKNTENTWITDKSDFTAKSAKNLLENPSQTFAFLAVERLSVTVNQQKTQNSIWVKTMITRRCGL